MVKYEDECVGCPTELGCLGAWVVLALIELCLECIEKMLEKVKPE